MRSTFVFALIYGLTSTTLWVASSSEPSIPTRETVLEQVKAATESRMSKSRWRRATSGIR